MHRFSLHVDRHAALVLLFCQPWVAPASRLLGALRPVPLGTKFSAVRCRSMVGTASPGMSCTVS